MQEDRVDLERVAVRDVERVVVRIRERDLEAGFFEFLLFHALRFGKVSSLTLKNTPVRRQFCPDTDATQCLIQF